MNRFNSLIVVSVIATISAQPDSASGEARHGFEAVRLTREEETGSSRFGTLIRTVLMVRR